MSSAQSFERGLTIQIEIVMHLCDLSEGDDANRKDEQGIMA